MMRRISSSLLFGATVAAVGFVGKLFAAQAVDFTKEIQPIFADRCYECHGEKKQKSGFRLDEKKVAFAGGESGKAAIIPGQSSESSLIKHITSIDKEEKMPPKGEPLTGKQIALLKTW